MIRLLLLSAFLFAASASAQELTFGTPLPMADASYTAADGSTVTLGDAAGPAGLVVVFWSDTCPWTERYTPRLASLVSTYTPAGIGFVIVNSNAPGDGDAAATARETATRGGLAVPYLLDPAGGLAAAFGARNTPHAFFFDGNLSLRYSGAIDDSPASPDRVRVPYLAQAMDQSVAAIPIEVQPTQAIGCTIDRAGE